MSGPRAYLDHNATSPLRPEVRAAMVDALVVGNPSSVHREGRAARTRVEAARRQVAALAGASPPDVTFLSGGAEASAAALRPGALLTPAGRPVARLLTSAAEHASVLHGHGFAPGAVTVCRVDAAGRLDLDVLADALAAQPEVPALVSLQAANNETGVLQPIAAAVALARRHGAAFHVDAVQAAGRRDLQALVAEADAVTLSAHKLGGPMGVGALVAREHRRGPRFGLVRGGGQERGARGGTENVAGIVGFGLAAEMAARDVPGEAARLARLRAAAEAQVLRLAPDAVVFAASAERLPNTLAFAVPGLQAETALMALDLEGVAVSSGSACSSGKVGRSHVLAAMGVAPALAAGAIRLSFGWNSSEADVDRFAAAFAFMLQRLYQERARAA